MNGLLKSQLIANTLWKKRPGSRRHEHDDRQMGESIKAAELGFRLGLERMDTTSIIQDGIISKGHRLKYECSKRSDLMRSLMFNKVVKLLDTSPGSKDGAFQDVESAVSWRRC